MDPDFSSFSAFKRRVVVACGIVLDARKNHRKAVSFPEAYNASFRISANDLTLSRIWGDLDPADRELILSLEK